jgi:hypothetical protein
MAVVVEGEIHYLSMQQLFGINLGHIHFNHHLAFNNNNEKKRNSFITSWLKEISFHGPH